MVERKASLWETLRTVKEAVSFALDQKEKADYRDDTFMFPWEKWAYAISILRPAELREWINILSSYHYGQWVFDSVFPKFDNPEDYHSTEFEICLTDNPIQVLGWAEKDELVQKGMDEGFQEDWINVGFILRSYERGIDIEWHFAEFVPQESKVLKINQLPKKLYDH
jgi:hypothetical protein